MKTAYRFLIFIAGLFAVGMAHAQNYQTALTGTITDTTGAIVPGAAVTVVNVATNATRTAPATSTGSYFVGNLPISRYTLTTSALGFGSIETKDIELVVGQIRQLDLRLNIGMVNQEVSAEDVSPGTADQHGGDWRGDRESADQRPSTQWPQRCQSARPCAWSDR
jgi:hypothetical protein